MNLFDKFQYVKRSDVLMIRRLYPYGKKKAFNVTYDDGVLQDVRFVGLLNQYGLKGTFNLNSAMSENAFEWTHECGLVVKRLKPEVIQSLYAGHEVASHTLTHPYMDHFTKEQILHELAADKANLEKLLCTEIKGFAVPFYFYSKLIETCVKECGFEYARISEESYSFTPGTITSTGRAPFSIGVISLKTSHSSSSKPTRSLHCFRLSAIHTIWMWKTVGIL